MLGHFNDGGLSGHCENGRISGCGQRVRGKNKFARTHTPSPRFSHPNPEKAGAFHVFNPDGGPHLPIVKTQEQIHSRKARQKARQAVHRVEEGGVQVAGAGHLDIPGDEESVVVRAGAIDV